MSMNSGKILILGAKGMLGGYLAAIFSDSSPILWDKDDLDITDRDAVRRKITDLKPDVVINAAAYTAVDDCEKNSELANKVNGEAVKYLVEAMNEAKPPSCPIFVHYSTDYVFDGKNSNGYKENDEPYNPINNYGESKLMGENHVLNYPKHYIIRTSWLYGKGGDNFVDTMLGLGKTHGQLKVVNDQHGKPTYAYDLAKRTRELLEGSHESGIYHVTNETEDAQKGIAWFEFAQEIFLLSNNKVDVIPCTSDEFPRPAKRPEWSGLVNTKLPALRNWKEALKEYLGF